MTQGKGYISLRHTVDILCGSNWQISFDIDCDDWTSYLASQLMKGTPEDSFRNLPEAITAKLHDYAKQGILDITIIQPKSFS